MNAITRELIERELEDTTFKRDRAVEEVEAAQHDLRHAEKRRDELNDKIGALKEDLGHKEVAVTLRAEVDDFKEAMRKFTVSVVKTPDPEDVAQYVTERLRRVNALHG